MCMMLVIFVDLDNIIDYAVMTHDVANAVDIQEGTSTDDALLDQTLRSDAQTYQIKNA